MSFASDAIKSHWLRVLAGTVYHSQPPEVVTITQKIVQVTVRVIVESPKQPITTDGAGETVERLNVFLMRDSTAALGDVTIGGIDQFKVGCQLLRSNGLKYIFQGDVLDLAEHYQVVQFVRKIRYAVGGGR